MSKKSSNKKVFSFKKYLVIFLVILSILFSGLIYFINVLPLEYFWVFIVTLGIIDVIVSLLLLSNGHVRNLVGGFFSFILIIGMIFGINYSLNTMDFFKQFGFNEYKIENYNILVLNTSNYKNIKDLNNQVIGYLDKDKYEGLNKAIDKLSKKISFKSNISSDVSDLFTKLEEKIVNAIILEDAQISILKEEVSNFDEIIKSIDVIEVEIKNKDIGKSVDVVNNSFNIYISGIDTYGSINKVSRSDVNIIMSVNPTTKEILLTNIPRDYYVKLHTFGEYDKLTHAGIYGINTVVQTIEDLFGIDINYYVRVNFTTVESLVNTIGPIEIYSDKAMSLDGCKYVVGTNTVNGKCALRFARERHSYVEGDNHRIKNQQEVIKGIFNKLSKSAMVVTDYTSILDSLDGKFATNIDMKDITAFIKYELEDITKYEILDTQVTGTGSMELTYSYPHQKLYVMFPSEQSVESAKEYINKISNEK